MSSVKKVKEYYRIPSEDMLIDTFGSEWRELSGRDADAAWGMAIIHAVVFGDIPPSANKLSNELRVPFDVIQRPLRNLSLNGVFERDYLAKDIDKLEAYDPSTWGYYAAYASGMAGPVQIKYRA